MLIVGNLGHDEIPQRPDRAHPFESANWRGAELGESGESEETLPEDAGVYQIEGV
jgi:hypothetical protein